MAATSQGVYGPFMLYVLVLPRFAPGDASAIDRLRARYEPKRAALVPPHLTLVFGVPGAEAAILADRCARIAAGQAPFPVVFDSAEPLPDPHEGSEKVALSVTAGGDDLIRLYGLLNTRPESFRPHMTVATASAPDPDALAEARRLPLPITAQADGLMLERLQDGKLTRLGHYPFTGQG